VLREQLRHITQATREFDLTVQEVPFTADAHAALTASFVIIQWPDEHDGAIAICARIRLRTGPSTPTQRISRPGELASWCHAPRRG
jgi:hypothetical protein